MLLLRAISRHDIVQFLAVAIAMSSSVSFAVKVEPNESVCEVDPVKSDKPLIRARSEARSAELLIK